VSKEFRRREIDRRLFGVGQRAGSRIPQFMVNGQDFRRHCEHELYAAFISISTGQQAPRPDSLVCRDGQRVVRHSQTLGIVFVQIGPEKDYHGIRAPYLVSIESIEPLWKRSIRSCIARRAAG